MCTCIIADDEKLARDVLKAYISRIDDLDIVAICRDALEVSRFLEQTGADILFLDIEMPQRTGLELIRSLKQPPRIILTTAYKEHALEAFELHVTDYLLKPFSFERFTMAVDKIRSMPSAITSRNDQFIDLRVERKMVKIPVHEIRYIEAIGNYIKIYMAEKMIIAYNTIQNMNHILPGHKFRQIHRSYIVNLDKVQQYTATTICVGKVQLPVGRRFKKM
ncbi:response regulator transcription factor [Rhodocytophaga rosea]|uniref:Response regulator transcription factor n=1 Tax=Rhodocytophaga rosea TaxID=2704465 RepID=A0A6C0GG54_9BACT|nr:LytTR family DNA-binding domain-containing protein [Rhodocytophaga rosea]QHT66855.1 response regulator transcription factor [Rhodocytophaga rosea]